MRYVALLRGINVGGYNKLPMKGLIRICGELGYSNTRHYIQSGNLVFEAERPDAKALSEAIYRRFDFAPRVMIFSQDKFTQIAQSSPFASKMNGENGKALHIYFMQDTPTPNKAALDKLKSETEEWAIANGAFHLWAPDGIGRSKLAENAPKQLGAEATARNWNTVAKILEILQQ